MSSRPKQPKYARNKNILVIGGSGSGKTRFFVKPNLMQMHSSYVVTDPKGTVLVECGKLLQRGGYRIKVLNTINFKKSMHDLVFVNWRTGEPAKNSSYDTHLYKLCDEAGIKRFCMHALRHTYATRAIERGVQPKVLQQLLGHASIKTTMDRYVHVTDESLVNAIRQFQQATPPVTKKGRKKGVQEI